MPGTVEYGNLHWTAKCLSLRPSIPKDRLAQMLDLLLLRDSANAFEGGEY